MKKNLFVLASMVIILAISAFMIFGPIDDRKDTSVQRDVINGTRTVYGPELDGPLASLSESFEGTSFPPAGWIKLNPDGGTGWTSITAGTTPLPGWTGGVATVPTGGGTKTAYASWNTGGATANDQWLITPQLMNVQAGDSLIFWLRKPGFTNSYLDHFDVKISTTTPVVANFTITVTAMSHPANTADTNWHRWGFRLGDFVTPGANIYIGFREWVLNNLTDGAAYQLDLVNVNPGSVTPTLTYPSNVCNYGTIPAYPSGVWAHGTEVLGDTLYIVGGGSAGSGSTTCQRYAINSNTFSLGTALPESKASAPLVRAGNSLYLIGGGASVSTNGTTCYKYTPGAGWTAIAPLPVGLSGHGAVCWGDSVIFVMGGPYSSPATGVYYYRIATNTWGTSTSCLAARRTAAYGIVGNKLIIMAGYNAAFYKNVQIGTIGANASTITWAAGPDVPGVKTGSSRPGGTGIGDRFYFVPGETTPAPYPVDSIFVFNVTSNTWMPNVYTGRGAAGTASNYWDAVSTWVAPSGNVKLFIAGGALSTAFPGLWSLQVPACTITGITGNGEIPATYNLSQNYPNPFNPTTKISYAIPKSGFVTLKIFDMLGREVANLVNTEKQAGSYIIDFDASNLSSGVYFYRIDVNGFTDIKKMTVLK